MDVSVIIVNYNTKDLTKQCIDSIFEHTSDVTFEVLLVDNASTDGSVELFEKDTRIRFLESGCNLGFGKANNLGAQNAEGKYLLLLNSDTILLNNAIKLFFDKMESVGQEVGCMGCLLQDAQQQYMHSYAELPNVENMLRILVWEQLFSFLGFKTWEMDAMENRKADSSFFQVGYVTGADLFIRRCAVETCGLFDPDFFMYYEDSELQSRYAKHGFYSYIYDGPQIVHLEGHSSEQGSSKRQLLIFDGMQRYLSKTQDRWKVLLLRLLLLIKVPYTIWSFDFNLRESMDYLRILFRGHLNYK